jgi:dTDP-4-amino-4,6-dideoxygalactose transaminase
MTTKENKMNVPLLDLKAQYATIKEEIKQAIDQVLESQHFIMGPQVKSLEEKIATYTNCKHAIGVASGSDALLISLMAIDLKPGDAVITTPYTFFATAGAISRLGAIPIFVDVDPRTYNIDPEKIEGVILSAAKNPKETNFLPFVRGGSGWGRSVKAIVPVHLYGQSADMDPIMEIARKHNLVVIEDAAQAIGTEYKGRRVGSIGHFGCFSFFPSKNLGGFGDGGMVTTNNDDYAERVRVLRVHGSKPKYYHKFVGMNSRLDTLQAAVIEVKLRYLDKWSAARKSNADWYNDAFTKAGLVDRHLITPYEVPGGRHIYNQYVIRAKNRDGLMACLKEKNIGTEIYYPVPLHIQECFAGLGYKNGDLPHSEAAAKETMALPIYPELTTEQKQYVVETIKEFYK